MTPAEHYAQGQSFRSVAVWPKDTIDRISSSNTDNSSTDWHESRIHAWTVCRLLQRGGFGGCGRMYPVKVYVEEVNETGEVIERWDSPQDGDLPPGMRKRMRRAELLT